MENIFDVLLSWGFSKSEALDFIKVSEKFNITKLLKRDYLYVYRTDDPDYNKKIEKLERMIMGAIYN
ncbi:MAG: hypothetical protein ACFFDN_04935 [Candidatus Hodarchaeota archaeon]